MDWGRAAGEVAGAPRAVGAAAMSSGVPPCRPPSGRSPLLQELAACPHTARQAQGSRDRVPRPGGSSTGTRVSAAPEAGVRGRGVRRGGVQTAIFPLCRSRSSGLGRRHWVERAAAVPCGRRGVCLSAGGSGSDGAGSPGGHAAVPAALTAPLDQAGSPVPPGTRQVRRAALWPEPPGFCAAGHDLPRSQAGRGSPLARPPLERVFTPTGAWLCWRRRAKAAQSGCRLRPPPPSAATSACTVLVTPEGHRVPELELKAAGEPGPPFCLRNVRPGTRSAGPAPPRVAAGERSEKLPRPAQGTDCASPGGRTAASSPLSEVSPNHPAYHKQTTCFETGSWRACGPFPHSDGAPSARWVAHVAGGAPPPRAP